MNNNLSQIDLIDNYYNKIGSTWLSDSFALFLLTPVGALSILLNLLNFIAFMKMNHNNNNNHQQSNLNRYFRVYTFICLLGCFIAMFYLSTSAHYLKYRYSYFVSLYRCVISQYLTTIIFYAHVLECIIMVERLSFFKQTFKVFAKIDPYKLCLIAFIICNLINLPYMFYYTIRSEQEHIEAINDFNLTYKEFTYCRRNPTFQTSYGKTILIIIVIVRDILTLILEFAISFASIIYFKKYLNERRHLFCLNITNNSDSNHVSLRYIIDITEYSLYRTENFSANLTKMTIYLSSCSAILHLSIAACYVIVVYIFNNSSLISNYFSLGCVLVGYVKYISNFYFFYKFFRNYRQFLKNLINFMKLDF